MGKGSRPEEAKTLSLVPGTGQTPDGGALAGVTEPSPPIAVDEAPVMPDSQLATQLEGGVPAPEDHADRTGPAEPPGYPTHLDATRVTDPTTPEELLSNLNHLALNDAIDEERFQELYLHHFGPLGATAGAAHDHWEALMARREVERQAARQLAEQMQAAIADVRPWNPVSDTLLARAEVDQVRVAFNSEVHQAQQQAANEHRAVAPHL
jgi:hypothetical protein